MRDVLLDYPNYNIAHEPGDVPHATTWIRLAAPVGRLASDPELRPVDEGERWTPDSSGPESSSSDDDDPPEPASESVVALIMSSYHYKRAFPTCRCKSDDASAVELEWMFQELGGKFDPQVDKECVNELAHGDLQTLSLWIEGIVHKWKRTSTGLSACVWMCNTVTNEVVKGEVFNASLRDMSIMPLDVVYTSNAEVVVNRHLVYCSEGTEAWCIWVRAIDEVAGPRTISIDGDGSLMAAIRTSAICAVESRNDLRLHTEVTYYFHSQAGRVRHICASAVLAGGHPQGLHACLSLICRFMDVLLSANYVQIDESSWRVCAFRDNCAFAVTAVGQSALSGEGECGKATSEWQVTAWSTKHSQDYGGRAVRRYAAWDAVNHILNECEGLVALIVRSHDRLLAPVDCRGAPTLRDATIMAVESCLGVEVGSMDRYVVRSGISNAITPPTNRHLSWSEWIVYCAVRDENCQDVHAILTHHGLATSAMVDGEGCAQGGRGVMFASKSGRLTPCQAIVVYPTVCGHCSRKVVWCCDVIRQEREVRTFALAVWGGPEGCYQCACRVCDQPSVIALHSYPPVELYNSGEQY